MSVLRFVFNVNHPFCNMNHLFLDSPILLARPWQHLIKPITCLTFFVSFQLRKTKRSTQCARNHTPPPNTWESVRNIANTLSSSNSSTRWVISRNSFIKRREFLVHLTKSVLYFQILQDFIHATLTHSIVNISWFIVFIEFLHALFIKVNHEFYWGRQGY